MRVAESQRRRRTTTNSSMCLVGYRKTEWLVCGFGEAKYIDWVIGGWWICLIARLKLIVWTVCHPCES